MRTVIVTGAASGIGEAIVRKMYEQGWFIYACDINEKRNIELFSDCENVQCVGLNIADEVDWMSFRNQLVDQRIRVDSLVNCAGIADKSAILTLTKDDWNMVLDINTYGTYFGMRTFLPLMTEHGAGSVVNIASIAADCAMGGGSISYAVSKSGVRTLSKRFAKEFGKYSIRVNTVIPGWINTPMTQNARKASLEEHMKYTMLPYVGEAEDVAEAVYFLVSDASRYITGSEIFVDGGFLK